MCDVLVDTSLLVAGETSLVLVGVSSVIVASGSSRVATKNSVDPLVALGSGVLQSSWYMGDPCPDSGCRLLSHCGACSTH